VVSVHGINGILWINGRYDDIVDAFTYLDGTPVPKEVLDLRDSKDVEENACMRYFGNMMWRDRDCTTKFGFICEKRVAGRM